MFERLLSFFVHKSLWDFRKLNDEINCYFPHQLVKIVEQAQRNHRFETDPHISVSAGMRRKLMHPLTEEQVLMISGTQYPVTENSFEYELAGHSNKKNELNATVMVNIDYCDTAKDIDIHHHNVPLNIKCAGRPGKGLEVAAVVDEKNNM